MEDSENIPPDNQDNTNPPNNNSQEQSVQTPDDLTYKQRVEQALREKTEEILKEGERKSNEPLKPMNPLHETMRWNAQSSSDMPTAPLTPDDIPDEKA